MKVTQKVHGELRAARQAKRTAKVQDPRDSVRATPERVEVEKAPAGDLCTFAFRITKGESAAIHAAAGKGKASKFARALLVAAAANDRSAVEALLDGLSDRGPVTV